MKLKKYEKLEEIDSYFSEIKKYKHLTNAEEKELAEKIKQGDEKALNKLVTSNLKFVVNIAKAYRKSGVPFSDLISEGNVGLMKAAKKFDGNKNIRFISYAVWWVKNSIQECIEEYQQKNYPIQKEKENMQTTCKTCFIDDLRAYALHRPEFLIGNPIVSHYKPTGYDCHYEYPCYLLR